MDIAETGAGEELPIGKDETGKIEADGAGAELIGWTINKISNRKMVDLRTLALRKACQ